MWVFLMKNTRTKNYPASVPLIRKLRLSNTLIHHINFECDQKIMEVGGVALLYIRALMIKIELVLPHLNTQRC